MASILQYCADAAHRAFDPGAVLLSEGHRTDRLYVLIEGEIEIVRDGVQVAVVSEPGAIFGEMSVLLDLPQTATVRALTPARAYELEDAKTFLRRLPKSAAVRATQGPLWYTPRMTTAETKRIERIARESSDLARKSLRKSNEIEAD